MSDWKIGCGGVGYSDQFSEEQILAEIAQAGYAGAPLSSRGGRSAAETVDLYQRFGLLPAPGYFSADYWRPEQRQDIVEQARKLARFHFNAGVKELYVATGGWDGYTGRRGLHRGEVSGWVNAEDGLEEHEWGQFILTLSEVCRATLDEGVKSCFHNHVGSVIETGDEFERLLDEVPEDLLFLGPDTGHLAWAGVDPVEFCRKYAGRIKTIHIKDVDESVRAEGVRQGWDYGAFCDHHLFTEIGDGSVDFVTIFTDLKNAGFDGWVIVETDVPRRASMLESNAASRIYLRSIGL